MNSSLEIFIQPCRTFSSDPPKKCSSLTRRSNTSFFWERRSLSLAGSQESPETGASKFLFVRLQWEFLLVWRGLSGDSLCTKEALAILEKNDLRSRTMLYDNWNIKLVCVDPFTAALKVTSCAKHFLERPESLVCPSLFWSWVDIERKIKIVELLCDKYRMTWMASVVFSQIVELLLKFYLSYKCREIF